MKKIKNTVYNTALCGILCAQAIALSFLEGLLPAVPFLPPGAKPGLSNIVTMFTAGSVGFFQAMTVTVVKSLFAFLTRGATAGAMSLAGGVVSTAVMWLLLRFSKEKLGLIGISVICALCHNASQLMVAVFIAGTKSVIYYAPVLGISGIAAGVLTGLLLKAAVPVLEKEKKHFLKQKGVE